MSFVFDSGKVTQEAAFLLGLTEGKRMPYLKLIKLLYIADRESIRENGFPISGDKMYAMKHGPVLSKVLDYSKGKEQPSEWIEHVKTEGYDLVLVDDPGIDKLSRYDVNKLTETFNRYRNMNEWDIRDLSHTFSEYEKNKPNLLSFIQSHRIPLADIAEAVGRAGDIKEIERNLAEDKYFASLSRG